MDTVFLVRHGHAVGSRTVSLEAIAARLRRRGLKGRGEEASPGRAIGGRPAEILVLAPEYVPLLRLSNLVCDNIEFDDGTFVIASRTLDTGHRVRIFGICVRGKPERLALDLLMGRVVGTVLLYPWEESEAQLRAEQLADWYESYCEAPLLVAAYSIVGNPLPGPALDAGLRLGEDARLMGVDLHRRDSVVNILKALLSMAAERAGE